MGKLVSSTIPNLISAVSQQPWNVRLPTQAEEQVNCQSSVTDFLKRRPATRHLARIRDTPAANGIASHHINRDETEQYIVTADASGINVFDLEGNAKTVSVTGTGAAYLAAATAPNRDLRFLTINDYTFVLNRQDAPRPFAQKTAGSHRLHQTGVLQHDLPIDAERKRLLHPHRRRIERHGESLPTPRRDRHLQIAS